MDVPGVAFRNVHSALLPDGRVLLWGTEGEGVDGDKGRTPAYAHVYDPATGRFSGPYVADTTLFCSGRPSSPTATSSRLAGRACTTA